MRWAPVFLTVMALLLSTPCRAHEVRPAYLDLSEDRPGEFSVLWKTPMVGKMRLALTPGFSGPVETLTPTWTPETPTETPTETPATETPTETPATETPTETPIDTITSTPLPDDTVTPTPALTELPSGTQTATAAPSWLPTRFETAIIDAGATDGRGGALVPAPAFGAPFLLAALALTLTLRRPRRR